MQKDFPGCPPLSLFFLILLSLLLFSAGWVSAQPDLKNGLLACYPFSGNANDVSSNANNGTAMGASLTTDRFGNTNSAYSFDGIDDYVIIPVGQLKNHFYSYSLWVNARTIPNEGETVRMLSIGGPGGDQDASLGNGYVAVSKGWDGAGYNTDGTVSHYSFGSLPSLNVWYHITVTRDEGTIKIYVNGQLAGTDLTNGKFSYYGSGTVRAIIGSRSTLTQYFNGSIDDIRLYNRALTAEEVELLYNAPNINAISIQSTNLTPCGGSTVNFTIAPAIGVDAQYQWKVDGIPAGTNSPTFTYSFPAIASAYTSLVSVEVFSEASCASDRAQMIVPVNPVLAPSVAITSDQVFPCAGSRVQFTATPTNGGSNPLYQWKVDGVNQGVPTTSPTFDYIFTSSTTDYESTISVEVMSSCAVTASAQMILTIHPPTPILASLLASNPTSCAEVPVVFEVNPSSAESSYAWKIDGVSQGNGINSSTIAHAFPKKAQAYTAKVSVEITHPSRLCAGKTTLELPMTVLPNPVVTCIFPEIVEAKSINVNQVLVTGGQPPYHYQWTFGSDRVVNGKDTISYRYASEGIYHVEVSVTDSQGCQMVCRSTQKVIRPLIFPNVFTPNGDTHNDTFTILYEGNDFAMHIYNRWGRLVAETVNGLYGWDGQGFPTGLYYYQITIASKEYKGWVSLLR